MIYNSPFSCPDTEFAALPDLVRGAAARAPDRPALIDAASGATVTYATLAARIGRVAAGLAQRGFAPGDVLAVRAPNIPPWAGVALGAMAAGGTVTGISPLATARETAAQLTDAGASVLVTLPSLAEESRAAAAATPVRDVVVVGDAQETAGSSETPAVTPIGGLLASQAPAPGITADPKHVALLPYSSGTTGLPKGVMLTHASLTAAARQLVRALGLTPRDRFLALAPFAHVMGFAVSLSAPLAVGAAVVTLPRYDLPALLSAIERYRVTVIAVPPPAFAALARDPVADGYDLSSLELIASGGASLSPELHEAMAARFPGAAVGQGYGLTETTAVISLPARAANVPGSAGRIAAGTQVRLVDPATSRDTAPGGPGELWVRGPQVMAGYLGQPQATAADLDPDGWLRTGDVARIDAHGNVFITGRLKELIKVNAYQVAPAELEALLASHPGVADVAVIPRPDERAGQVPVAVIVPRGTLSPDALIAWVTERVAPHKRIRAVQLASQIPRTPSGKILRRILIEEDQGAAGRPAAPAPAAKCPVPNPGKAAPASGS
ncbi:MAG TPA: AMP-binding protein [Trebonia sp.]